VKKKLIITAICLTSILVPLFASGIVAAGDGSMPAAKTAAVSDCISVTGQRWTKIEALDLAIKTGTPKDLVITVSLESSLMTQNKIKGSGSTEAQASVDVLVKVDGEPVWVCDTYGDRRDAIVVFNRRLVRLSGDLSHNVTVTPTGIVEVEIEDHWLELYMETKSANSFSFIARDVGPNVSNVEVWVRAWGYGRVDPPDREEIADFLVTLGKASVVVDEVNLKDS
jgi:hypothetical protein